MFAPQTKASSVRVHTRHQDIGVLWDGACTICKLELITDEDLSELDGRVIDITTIGESARGVRSYIVTHQVVERSTPVGEHLHNGWFCCEENMRRLATRIRAGECATVDNHLIVSARTLEPWCLTHGVPDDLGHAHDRGRTSSLD